MGRGAEPRAWVVAICFVNLAFILHISPWPPWSCSGLLWSSEGRKGHGGTLSRWGFRIPAPLQLDQLHSDLCLKVSFVSLKTFF